MRRDGRAARAVGRSRSRGIPVFVRYPKTRKPGLVLGCLGLAAGGAWYGISSYQERRHYRFCDIYANKDHSVDAGRTSERGMQCYRGLDACINARDKPVDPAVADIFKDASRPPLKDRWAAPPEPVIVA